MARMKIDSTATTAATRQIWQRARQTAEDAKPVIAQVKPLANETKAAASRGVYQARSWAAPQVERSGQVLQDTVAPKVAAALHTSAQKLDPEKAKHTGWRIVAAIAAVLAAAAAVAVGARSRMSHNAETQPDEEPAPPLAEQAKADAAHTA